MGKGQQNCDLRQFALVLSHSVLVLMSDCLQWEL